MCAQCTKYTRAPSLLYLRLFPFSHTTLLVLLIKFSSECRLLLLPAGGKGDVHPFYPGTRKRGSSARGGRMTGEVANSAGVRKAATNKSRPAADGGGKQKVHSTGGVSVGLARPTPAPPRP